jgi:hypothetical protein
MCDLHLAKCLLDNGASVRLTFSGKRASTRELVTRERKINYFCLLLPDAGNQVNIADADGRFPAHLCIEYDFVAGFWLLDLETSGFNRNIVSSQHPKHSTGR